MGYTLCTPTCASHVGKDYTSSKAVSHVHEGNRCKTYSLLSTGRAHTRGRRYSAIPVYHARRVGTLCKNEAKTREDSHDIEGNLVLPCHARSQNTLGTNVGDVHGCSHGTADNFQLNVHGDKVCKLGMQILIARVCNRCNGCKRIEWIGGGNHSRCCTTLDKGRDGSGGTLCNILGRCHACKDGIGDTGWGYDHAHTASFVPAEL